MLAIRSKGKIVERIVKTKAGEWIVATFLVIEDGNEFHFQLLSVKPIGNSERAISLKLTAKSRALCLPGRCAKEIFSARRLYAFAKTSPYFDRFEFFLSQPTRAPSRL